MADRDRAKEIIAEIVRAADGCISGKTRLFKAFYFAHLYYAKAAPEYLSDWPIVRMPRGPGIHEGDRLIGELIAGGILQPPHRIQVGPYDEYQYRITNEHKRPSTELPAQALDAIREAARFVTGQSAAELSELTHSHSRSWRQASEGEALNIYVDLISDDEYDEYRARAGVIVDHLEKAWE